MKCSTTLDIAAPIDRVFTFVEDPEKLKLWLKGLQETTYLPESGPGGKGVGTRFRQKIGEGGRVNEYDGEVTAYAPPKHLAVRIFADYFAVDVNYRFTPVAGGTRLDYSAEATGSSWFMRFMGWLMGWMMRRMVQKQLARLKELAEADQEFGSRQR